MAADLLVERRAEVLEANAADVVAATERGESATVVDRLRLDESKVDAMAGGLRQVAALADPVGEVTARLGATQRSAHQPGARAPRRRRHHLREPSQRHLRRVRPVPEVGQRRLPPRVVRRDPLEPRHRRGASRDALVKAGLPADALVMVDDTSRESAVEFMRQRGVIDCLIPRGGASLIASILEHATVPYIIDGDGNCHLYVDEAADLDMAESILVNGKTQRPSVCNALESLVVHAAVAAPFLARLDAAHPRRRPGRRRACLRGDRRDANRQPRATSPASSST